MKFNCNQKTLANKINIAQKAINSKTTIELLKGLLLTVKNNLLTITGYDNDISIETFMEVDVIEEGSIVINAKLIGEIIRKLPDGLLELKTDDSNNVYIYCKNSKFMIKGISPSEFPEIKEVKYEKTYNLSQELLKNMIKKTVFARSLEMINPILTGELFEIENCKLNLAALDGYRLAVKASEIEGEDISKNDYLKVIINGQTLQDLNSLLTENGDVKVGVDDKNIIFMFDDTRIVARLMDGNFVDYKNLLPKEYNTLVTVNKRTLQESIERAALLFQTEKNNLIKLSIKQNKLSITSNSENGAAYEEVNVEVEGNDLDIAFNSRYMLDGIKNIDSEFLKMEFGGPINPCVIKPDSNQEYLYLLLPVRLVRD